MTDSRAVEPLARALEAVDRLVAGVLPGQWSAATPCPEWTVRELLDHLVRGNQLVAAAMVGMPAAALHRAPAGRAATSSARIRCRPTGTGPPR